MEVQEYTFAQIASQLQRVINENKATVALHAMMVKAAQAETYLAEHEAAAARIEEALDAQRAQLVEAAEAYKELQEAIGADKHAHNAKLKEFSKIQLERRKEHDAKVNRIEESAEKEIHELEAYLVSTKEELRLDEAEARDVLDVLYAKLEEADKKLAALRESL